MGFGRWGSSAVGRWGGLIYSKHPGVQKAHLGSQRVDFGVMGYVVWLTSTFVCASVAGGMFVCAPVACTCVSLSMYIDRNAWKLNLDDKTTHFYCDRDLKNQLPNAKACVF